MEQPEVVMKFLTVQGTPLSSAANVFRAVAIQKGMARNSVQYCGGSLGCSWGQRVCQWWFPVCPEIQFSCLLLLEPFAIGPVQFS